MWRVVNTVTGRQKRKVDPACSADSIGEVFHSVVTDSTRPTSLGVNLGPATTSEALAAFSVVDEERVRRLLQGISASKATGSDGVPGALLKACADILAPSLCVMFNTH